MSRSWQPSKIGADVLAFTIDRWRAGALASPQSIAKHFGRQVGLTNVILAALRKHGYVRNEYAGKFAVTLIQPLRHVDGTLIEGASPLAGCKVEVRKGVKVTICPPKHVAPATFRQFGLTG